MSGKKKVFDDGFDAFEGKKDFIDKFAEGVATVGERVLEIPLEKTRVKENVRKEYKEIESLAESIRTDGLLSPITVQKTPDGFFDILTGHRRYKAFLYLSEKHPGEFGKIRALVFEKELTRVDVVRIQLTENLQRENPSALETKEGLEVMRESGKTHKQIAQEIHKSEGYVNQLFSTVNTLNANPELAAVLRTDVNVSLSDLQEIRPLSTKDQVEIIREKLAGKIKNVKELRERVRELKDAGYQEYRQKREEKQKTPPPLLEEKNGRLYLRLSFDPAKDDARKKEIVAALKEAVEKIEAMS